jgi:hypothetical protein
MELIGIVIEVKKFEMGEIWDNERELQKLSDEYDKLLEDEFNATRKLLALKNEFDELSAPSDAPPSFSEDHGIEYFGQYDSIEEAPVRNDVVVLRRRWIRPPDPNCRERRQGP